MTSERLTHYQATLAAAEADLQELLRNREEIAVNSNSDVLDQIQHSSECQMAVVNLDRKSSQLREVRAALRRMHVGTFGTCMECEEEIGVKRLDAVPWAPFCIVCQELEDRSRMSGGETIEPTRSSAA
jgi:DnaK suppressor protein